MTDSNLGLPCMEPRAGGVSRLLAARARRRRPARLRPLWAAIATTALVALAVLPFTMRESSPDFSAQLRQAMAAPSELRIEVEGGAALELPTQRDDVQIVLVMHMSERVVER